MDESIYTLRHARSSDALAIRSLTRTVWLATYPHPLYKITVEDIKLRFEQSDKKGALQKLQLRLGRIIEGEENFVITKESAVVAFARGIRGKEYNEIKILNVSPEHQRKGLGNRLWKRIRSSFNPKKPSFVSTAVYNYPAIAFYHNAGFQNHDEFVIEPSLRMPNGILMITKRMMRPAHEP